MWVNPFNVKFKKTDRQIIDDTHFSSYEEFSLNLEFLIIYNFLVRELYLINFLVCGKHNVYLDEKIDPDHQLHLDFGVDLVIEVVVGDLVNISHVPIVNCVHQRSHVSVDGFVHQVREIVKNGQTAHVKWNPLVVQEIPVRRDECIGRLTL